LDVLGAWDWLQQTHSLSPPQIGLAGFSMGGATVIHAMADEPQIAAGWSDSAFDSMQRVVAFHTEAAGLPLLFAETVFPVGAIFFGVDVLDDRAIDAVQMLEDHPLYLVHSTNDAIVPFASAVALYEAARQTNDNIDFWKIDASPHVLHMVHAPQMYEQRLVDFFETHLQSADS
ncbi:MAG: alpha/beta hydrolase, partial [Aggregatilineales bacterium]